VAWDVFAGNTADTAALTSTIARFRERFSIRRAVVVADSESVITLASRNVE
jgi:hypothetical protein